MSDGSTGSGSGSSGSGGSSGGGWRGNTPGRACSFPSDHHLLVATFVVLRTGTPRVALGPSFAACAIAAITFCAPAPPNARPTNERVGSGKLRGKRMCGLE